MATVNAGMFERINHELLEGKYYESMQHIITLVRRNALRKNYRDSMNTLYKYALVYMNHKQYVLAGELMDEYSKVAEDGNVKFGEQDVKNLIDVFDYPWKKSTDATTFKDSTEYSSTMSLFTKFMNRAIRWSQSEEFPNGNPQLHKALGLFHQFNKEYSKAQGNLVYSRDPEALLELVNEWKQEGDKDEGDFFYLRAVLMLMATNDVCNAKCFVYLLGYDLEDTNVCLYFSSNNFQTPLPIQFAHLLCDSCDPPKFELFKQVVETYKTLIDMDKEYKELVKTIRDNYFKNQQNPLLGNQAGFESSLSNLLQALM